MIPYFGSKLSITFSVNLDREKSLEVVYTKFRPTCRAFQHKLQTSHHEKCDAGDCFKT